MISPKKFIKSHMPFDPIWQFLTNPINNAEFASGDFTKNEQQGDSEFRDSIEFLENQGELTQLHNTSERIIASMTGNENINSLIKKNLSTLAILRYNLAVDYLNEGIENYNLYVNSKNRKFRKPKLGDTRIKGLIDCASLEIHSADMEFNKLSTEKNGPKELPKTKGMIIEVISDLNREKKFVAKYLKVWKPLRIFLF